MTLTTLRLSESGARIGLRDAGRGEPVVLLHGVGLQSAAWHPQIATLSQGYRVIALDLPGHGASDTLPGGSQLPDFVAWCHDAVQALDLGPVNLVGHSMGALIAVGFAALHPAMTRRVALLNGVYLRDDAARRAVVDRAEQISAGAVDIETPLSRWFEQSPAQDAARDQVAGWLADAGRSGYATAYTAFAQGDATYADKIARISCPFLAVTGDGDPNSTPAMSRAMAAQAVQGKAVIVKDHRHMVNLTAPDQINAHLLSWLKLPAEKRVFT